MSRAVSNGTPNERKDSHQALPAASSKMEEPLVDKGRLDVLSTPQKCGVLPKSTKGQESRSRNSQFKTYNGGLEIFIYRIRLGFYHNIWDVL